MSIAHTSSFYPMSLEAVRQTIHDHGLTEDLNVRPSPTAGQVILYAMEGASSWPYDSIVGEDLVPFEIEEFLAIVARPCQEIEVHENGEYVVVTI